MQKMKQFFIKVLILFLLMGVVTPASSIVSRTPISITVEAAYSKTMVKKVQQKLNDLGYNCGTADGVAGSKTKAAIKKYQKENKLTVTGTINSTLLKSLGISASSSSSIQPSKSADSKSNNSSVNKETMVYITDTGEKYHRSNCNYLRKSKHAISLSDAKASGYTACSVCKPS